jgi:hypothetical protein
MQEDDIIVAVEGPEGLNTAVSEFVAQLNPDGLRAVVELQMISYMVEKMFPAKEAGSHFKKTDELFFKMGLRLMKMPRPLGKPN